MARIYMPFEGFTLFGVHSSKFKVYRILNSDKYTSYLNPNFETITESVHGYEGEYDFGVNIKSRPITLRCYCDGITEAQKRQLEGWLSPKKKGKLILDEAPYKAYIVRLARPVEFSFMPLRDTSGEIYYYGYFNIELIATQPYAYSTFTSLDPINYDDKKFYNAGLLYVPYLPPASFTNITNDMRFVLYNGGTEKTNVNVKIEGTWSSLKISNLTTNQEFILSAKTVSGLFEVDANYGQCRLNGLIASQYHSGTYIQLIGTDRVDHYVDVLFTNGSNIVTFSDDVVLDDDISGRFIFLEGSQYKIANKISDNQVKLSTSYTGTTGYYNVVIVQANEILLTGSRLNISSLQFEYRYMYS